jgi:beta-glucosidase
MRRITAFAGCSTLALVLASQVASAAPPSIPTPAICAGAPCLYLDPSAAPEARAADLIKRMTLEEKVSQMQDQAPGIARLGVPAYGWWNEVLHGVARAGHATVFPQAIALSATWDQPLMHGVGAAIGVEGRAKHNAAFTPEGGTARYYGVNYWTPNINIFRDPRWGRGQETYGEDPFLTGSMARAFVTGVQGDDPAHPLGIATAKHFAVHSGPEPARHGFNVDPSPHDLQDTYLPAFRMAMADAKAGSLMCAYNAVDHSPACDSTMLLQDELRDDWGFKGFVVSDCDAVDDTVKGHKTQPDAAHASAAAVKAGTDLDCGRTYAALTDAVKQGLISEADLDKSLMRLFTARMRLGLFDPGQGRWGDIPMSAVHSPEHQALALKAAEEAIVLLRNREGLLPLKGQGKIAVVGPNADLLQALEANYNGVAVDPITPLRGMRAQFGAERIVYAPGGPLVAAAPMPVPAHALFAMDGTPGLKGEYWDNPDFTGDPKSTGYDPILNFDWNHAPPHGLNDKAYSARWTGTVVPPGAGDYQFAFRLARRWDRPQLGDAAKLWIDGKLVLDAKDSATHGAVHFDDAKPHQVRIDYVHTGGEPNFAFQWIAPSEPQIAAAVEAAKQSGVVVAFVGLSPDLEGEEMKVDYPGFHGGDRTDVALPEAQHRLLEALKATGKPLVVVSMSGSAIGDPWLADNADAVVQAWYPGEAGGKAIAETLAGVNNPSGRLPVTFYRDVAELPPFDDYRMAGRTYRYFSGPVLYPFGYGLSYTKFDYAGLEAPKSVVKAGQPVEVGVEVRNAGAMAGDEVVEVYVQGPASPVAPLKALAGFKRVHLEPGEAKKVTFSLAPRALGQVDAAGVRRVDPGVYRISVGGGQPGQAPGASGEIRIEDAYTLPK